MILLWLAVPDQMERMADRQKSENWMKNIHQIVVRNTFIGSLTAAIELNNWTTVIITCVEILVSNFVFRSVIPLEIFCWLVSIWKQNKYKQFLYKDELCHLFTWKIQKNKKKQNKTKQGDRDDAQEITAFWKYILFNRNSLSNKYF